MLSVLYRIENTLPGLLADDGWHSLLIDYHAPYVERLWRDCGEYRVSLHRIMACAPGDALPHHHPWPSAMRIVRGTYEMAIGTTRTDITSFAQGGKQKLVPAATVLLLAGSAYEMVNQNGWHSVRPVTDVTLSVMVTGRPWSRQGPKSGKKLNPLAQHTVREMLGQFRKYYCINE